MDPARTGNRPIREVLIPRHGVIVHLKGYGLIKVFKIATPNGGSEYWATSDLTMTVERCAEEALRLWCIEEYHRGLKQFCGIERARHRAAITQRNHIGLAIRAFCAWRAIGFEPACLGLKPRQPLSVGPYGLPWSSQCMYTY